jgi:hypothetical protein
MRRASPRGRAAAGPSSFDDEGAVAGSVALRLMSVLPTRAAAVDTAVAESFLVVAAWRTSLWVEG